METPQPSFAYLLKRYRMAAGLTQEELAEQANVSSNGVGELERGINRAPRPDTMQRLATALCLSEAERAALEDAARRRRRGPRAGAGVAAALPEEVMAPPTTAANTANTPIVPPTAANTANTANTPIASPVNATDTAGAPPAPSAPTPLTSLIGREADLAAATAALRGGTRLLTLAGPGGVGKTRLALEIAARLRDAYAGGSVFVPLAAIADPALVPAAIAQALGLPERDNRPLRDTLVGRLSGAHMLLLLDNFEHVVAAAPLVADLLASCPDLHILVTSRTLLRLRGERAYTVEPLVVPAGARSRDATAVAAAAATQLFLARARDGSPGFALTEANAPLLARICARLDGLPLAIELAAARLKVLTLSDLLARLESGLRVLSGGPRDLPERQRTLRDTIAWSYDLLDAPARALFLRLAVFAGGCALRDMEALCDASAGREDDVDEDIAAPEDVLDALTALIDNSLLRREEHAGEAEPRFTMLRTVREYALERLQGYAALEPLRQQHATYVLAVAEAAESGHTGADQAMWAARLERDQDNLRAALAWALDGGHSETALRLAGALWWFWQTRGYPSEGRRWLDRAITGADAAGLTGAPMAAALNNAAVLAATTGAYDEAAALFERSLTIRQELGDEHASAAVLNNLGTVAKHQHDYERAAAFYARTLTIRRALGEARGVARVLGNLGELARLMGDAARATEWAAESLAIYTRLEDISGAAQTLHTLGGAALLRGDLDGAAAAYRDALEQFWSLGDILDTASALEGLAVVAMQRARHDHAAVLFGAASVPRESGDAPPPPQDHAANDRALAAIRARLGSKRFAAAWAAGRALPLAQTVILALDDAGGGHTADLQLRQAEVERQRDGLAV